MYRVLTHSLTVKTFMIVAQGLIQEAIQRLLNVGYGQWCAKWFRDWLPPSSRLFNSVLWLIVGFNLHSCVNFYFLAM